MPRRRPPSMASTPQALRGRRRRCGRSYVEPATVIAVGRGRRPHRVPKISASVSHPTHCHGSQNRHRPPELAWRLWKEGPRKLFNGEIQ